MDHTENIKSIFEKYARAYQDKYMDQPEYHASFDLFCSFIRESAELLELACGPGNITRHLLKKRPDFRILGTDLSPKMVELAKKNNPSATFQVMDCRDINRLDKKFDAVICGFGLPYLSKQEAIQLIRDVADLLKAGGSFYLSTMEGTYSQSGGQRPSSGGEDILYTYYHEGAYLADALKEAGFQIQVLHRQKVIEQSDDGGIQDLIIIAQKH